MAVDRALEWITDLHRATRGAGRDPAEYGALARSVLMRFSAWAGIENGECAKWVSGYIEEQLTTLQPPTVQGHGDYWLGNILLDSEQGHVSGVLDPLPQHMGGFSGHGASTVAVFWEGAPCNSARPNGRHAMHLMEKRLLQCGAARQALARLAVVGASVYLAEPQIS